MKLIIAISLILLFAVACATPIVEQTLTPPTIKTQVNGVAVISPTGEDKGGFADCVRGSISRAGSNLAVIPEKEFRDAMFPWYEPETQPTTWGELQNFVTLSVVQKRLHELGVRYVIEAGGETTSNFDEFWSGSGDETYIGQEGVDIRGRGSLFKIDKQGTMLCYGACIGVMGWTRTSSVSVTLWDLEQGSLVGDLGAEVTGKNVLPALVFAFPFMSPTETAACNEIGERLAEFIAGGGIESHQPGALSNENPTNEE
jgi:hypothetical protein